MELNNSVTVPIVLLASAFVLVFSLTMDLHSQLIGPREKALLLPEEQVISGVVVDSSGNPVGKTYINHAAGFNQRQGSLWVMGFATDDNGKFSIQTRSPVLVFMKPGFRSLRIRVEKQSDLKVILERVPTKRFPFCVEITNCNSLGKFCFPRIDDVKASAPGFDFDYVAQSFLIDTPAGRKGIRYGSGPMWSFGMPFTEDVWTSTDYDEVVYEYPKLWLTDARGKSPDGKLWRYLGAVGESADYRGVDETSAAKLDRLLDGMCILQEDQR